LDEVKEKRRYWNLTGSTISHSVANSTWKRLRSCRKTSNEINGLLHGGVTVRSVGRYCRVSELEGCGIKTLWLNNTNLEIPLQVNMSYACYGFTSAAGVSSTRCVPRRFGSLIAAVPKMCSADPKESAINSQEMCRYISVMATLKFTEFLN
jgi:hypothetical protein